MRVSLTARLAAVAAVACSSARPNIAIVTGPELPSAQSVWVVGVAANAKQGAVVVTGNHALSCAGRPSWPAELAGKPVVVAGRLQSRDLPAPPVGPDGERSAGAEGAMWTLAPCTSPPAHPSAGLLDAERALFAALARRDRAQLERLIAPELVLRVHGQADADRAALLDSISTTPGTLEVTGEKLQAHDAGDTGIVEGIQVARVTIDGKVVEDRGAFVDVFARRDGAWRLIFALNVSLTDPLAQ